MRNRKIKMRKMVITFAFATISTIFVGCESDTLRNDDLKNQTLSNVGSNKSFKNDFYSNLSKTKNYRLGNDDYLIEISNEVLIHKMFISEGENGKLIAKVSYWKNSLNENEVDFEIIYSDNLIQIKELSGLKRAIKIAKDDSVLNFQYFINDSLVNREETKYTFSDLFQIAKNSGNTGVEIPVIEETNEFRGTLNIFASRCSTAQRGMANELKVFEGSCHTSGVDCISFLFACWCSAIVDCPGAGGSW